MDLDATYTLLILTAVVLLLFLDWVPPGITGLGAIVALAAFGVLPLEEAIAGMTAGAVITVGSMFVLSAALTRTGAASWLANRISSVGGTPTRTYHALLFTALVSSAFVNNTPLVLILLPLMLRLAEELKEPPSRLLIPLSFVSILGGMCTVIGTSTNLVVASTLEQVSGGDYTLGIFDFSRLGLPLAVLGTAFLVLFRRALLPDRASLSSHAQHGLAAEYMTEIQITAQSPWAGRKVSELGTEALLGSGLRVLEVVRGAVIQFPHPDLELRAGDLLFVKGTPEAVLQLRQNQAVGERPDTVRDVALTLFEVLVTPGTPWIGQRVSRLGLRDRFGASVFAIQRHGAHLREKLDHLRLQAGDLLLVQGSETSVRQLRDSIGLVVVEGVEARVPDSRHAPLAALAFVLFVTLAISRVVSIELSALIAALFAVATRSISAKRAYDSVSWDLLFLLGGTLALGRAFEASGLAEQTAHALTDVAAPFGIHAVLGVLMLVTTLLTQILSNNATAAIMTPLAYQLGLATEDIGPMPFVMAVAFGANCCFLTPVSYNTNLLVYGPGGYRFADFLRPGLPLTLIFLGLSVFLLPILY